MKRAWVVLALPWVLCLVLTVLLLQSNCSPGNGPTSSSSILTHLYTRMMENASYTPAVPTKKPHIGDDSLKVLEPAAVETIWAEGTWSPPDTIFITDTLEVKASGVVLDDGSKWIRITIAGKPVSFSRVEWFEKQIQLGRWSAGMEWAVLHGGDSGLYGSYRLFTLWKIRGGIALVVDYVPEDPLRPTWGAVEFRLDYPLTKSFEVGIGGGAHLTADDIDWHASIGAGFRF